MAAVPLRTSAGLVAASENVLTALGWQLDRSKLAARTIQAYRRQARAYTTWLSEHHDAHGDAYTDIVGAEGAVAAWRRRMIEERLAPASINQALSAVTLLYELAGLRIHVDRMSVPCPAEPDVLSPAQDGAVLRSAAQRGPRDAAIIAVLRFCGARAEECARLNLDDITMTARSGTIRLHGKGDEVRDVPIPPPGRKAISGYLDEVRGREPGPLWFGQRGRLTTSGITQVVAAVGADAGMSGLTPHPLRHTYATRLRQAGVDIAVIQALLGHGSLDSTARYFGAGAVELATVVERVFTD